MKKSGMGKSDVDESPYGGLATDLYQLTMAAGYYLNGRNERASFELFLRRMPKDRSYLIVAGLEQALEYLEDLKFTREEIDYLRGLPTFEPIGDEFFEYLARFRFSGDVWAMPEGTVAFAGEPLLRVTAPLIEAQIVETFLLSTINFQTMIASKASRVVGAAAGRSVIEFGARRCHGFGAAIDAARAAFIGGCVGTSNVEAGRRYGLPLHGTTAHSWTMAFEQEMDAFEAYYKVFPESTTLLLDTYDVVNAAHLATRFGPALRGVRLDSGDLTAQSKQVRAILDAAGMEKTLILASGDLNEYRITELLAEGAPIDGFGVGTDLSTSRDAPALGGVYKLVEVEMPTRVEPKMKLSRDKVTYPYRKQVLRKTDSEGKIETDVIVAADEIERPGEPLLHQVMKGGARLQAPPTIHESRERARRQLAALPARYQTLREADVYPVHFSEELERRRLDLARQYEENGRRESPATAHDDRGAQKTQ
jgi:nicotinate phosphoribosyltransferase